MTAPFWSPASVTPNHHRKRWTGVACALALALLVQPRARAACVDGSLLTPLTPNGAYLLNAPDVYAKLVVSRAYWAGFAVYSNDPLTDYDVYMYATGTGGASPYCFSTMLGSSTNGGGRTDFVIGDFNHNPLGTYFGLGHCFGGTCATPSTPGGIWGWRDGELITVNGPVTSVTVGPTDYPDQMLHCYDVWLTAGTKYFFTFTNTGPNDIKLCLFRNPFGGVYWAGRNAAEFEVTGYRAYVAPSTGYYGVVAVTDSRFNTTTTYTIAVSTDPSCSHASALADGVPAGIDSTQTVDYYRATQPDPAWMALGVRGHGGDWDVYAGPPTTSDTLDGCPSSDDMGSTLYAGKADVIAGDFDFGGIPLEGYTEAVKPTRYNGTSGATLELARGLNAVWIGGGKRTGSLNANDVVRIWQADMNPGEQFSIAFQTYGASQKLLMFENSSFARAWRARSQATLETSGNANYTSTMWGSAGLALVKDDDLPGSYLIQLGQCYPPDVLSSQTPRGTVPNTYLSFGQGDTTWCAVGVFSSAADWDLQLFGSATGSAWPSCFGSPGALSESSTVPDFVVGDFHHNPLDSVYVHSYQFTSNLDDQAFTEWDSGRGTLVVNAPPVAVSLATPFDYADRLFCYQVYLQNGIPYTFEFSSTGRADTHLLLFCNAGKSTYWAPRSGAVFSVTANQAYTAPATGWYGVVVANDNDATGSFSVRVSSAVVGVPNPGRPLVTGLDRVTPNPARGSMRIAYSNAEPAPASFEVLDMAGRAIARLGSASATAGTGEVTWDGRGTNGARVAAGIYFVRMNVAGRAVGTRKVVWIE